MMLKVKLFLILFLCSFTVFAIDDVELDEDGNPIVVSEAVPTWSINNKNIELSSDALIGKAYVLHFWATWCPYCKRLQPGLETIAIEYVDKGIETYAISFWENPRAKPTQEMESRGLSFKVLEKGDEVAKLFGVQSTPTTIFVNHKGEVSFKYMLSDPNDPQLRLAYETLIDEIEQEKRDLAEAAALAAAKKKEEEDESK
ncbi:MAG: thiol-disulfide isomerase/thioredoxin [Psychrosphaera sp.]|jgi:thiol-disulfide isomerase/thioredoxin